MKITFEVSREAVALGLQLLDAGILNPNVGLKALETPHASEFVMALNAAVQVALSEEGKPAKRARKKPSTSGEQPANG